MPGDDGLLASRVEYMSSVLVAETEKLLESPTQTIVALTDGSEAAHQAFLVAMDLVKGEDTLTVMHVKSDKDYHGPDEYKADKIKARRVFRRP